MYLKVAAQSRISTVCSLTRYIDGWFFSPPLSDVPRQSSGVKLQAYNTD